MAVTLLPTPKTTSYLIPLKSKNSPNAFSKDREETVNSIRDVEGILVARMNVRKKLYRKFIDKKVARQLYTIRAQRESYLETIKNSIKGNTSYLVDRVADTGKGILWRVLKVLGLIAAGWFLRNLPTWMGYVKEFISRITKIGEILKSFIGNMQDVMSSTGKVLQSFTNNIMRLNFFDTEGDLRSSFGELIRSIEKVGGDYEEAFKVFTDPLSVQNMFGESFGNYSGEMIPELGSNAPGRTDEPSAANIEAPSSLFDTIAKGEGSYESMNQGTRGGKIVGSTHKASSILGKNLQDMTLAEIMQHQRRGSLFAAGKFQVIPRTMIGFVNWLKLKGYDPNTTKYDKKIQNMYAQYTIESKRPLVGKYLTGKTNDLDRAVLELAAEFASVGVPFDMKAGSYGPGVPRRDIRKGESLYPGTGNAASISPDDVKRALLAAKKSGNINTVPSANNNKGSNGKLTSLSGMGKSISITPFKKGADATITSLKGPRWGKQHKGVDIAAPTGTPLYAYLPGKVTRIGNEGNRGYGHWIEWQDSVYGEKHLFAHLPSPSPLKEGQQFSKGTMLGKVGNSGGSTGPHLHWEIGAAGKQVDPIQWVNSKKIDQSASLASAPSAPELPPPPNVAIERSQKPNTIPGQITPTREQPNILAYIESPKAAKMTPQQSGGSSPSGGTTLNSLMKQRLLLELSYT